MNLSHVGRREEDIVHSAWCYLSYHLIISSYLIPGSMCFLTAGATEGAGLL